MVMSLDSENASLQRSPAFRTAGYESMFGGLATTFPSPYPLEPTYVATVGITVGPMEYLFKKAV